MTRELTRRAFLGDVALVGVASAVGLDSPISIAAAAAAPSFTRV